MVALCSVVSCLLLPQAVSAKETSLTEKIQFCSEINKDKKRLSCFDQLSKKQPEVAKVGLTTQEVDSFAKEHVKKTEEELAKEINSISLTISKVSKTLRGELKITFSNGQKWQQKDSIRMKLKIGEKVSLHKGAFGSVYLQKESGNKRIKVKRLK